MREDLLILYVYVEVELLVFNWSPREEKLLVSRELGLLAFQVERSPDLLGRRTYDILWKTSSPSVKKMPVLNERRPPHILYR